jgi:Gram-negative porin
MEHPMKARVRTAALAGAALFGGAANAAEPVTEVRAMAAVLATVSEGGDAEELTARAAFRAQYGVLFDNQIELGVGLGAAAERDDPRRDPRGGLAGDCPPASPACASLAGAPLRGLASGYYTAGALADEGARLELEFAYLYLRGGWGEASLGRDEGAGKRLSLLPPTVLAIGGVIDAPVDGTGLGGVTLRNDVSGQSAKLFAATTRIVGLQAAASFTPRIEHEGLDQGFRTGPGAPAVFEAEDIWEGGLSYAGVVGGWEAAAGATFALAEDRQAGPALDEMAAWSVGATLARGGWSVGLAWLENDNGWAGGGRDYTAIGGSAVRDWGDWALMLEAAASSDNLTFVDTNAATFAMRRKLDDRWSLAGGANWRDRSSPVGNVLSRTQRNQCGFGAFLEISFGL